MSRKLGGVARLGLFAAAMLLPTMASAQAYQCSAAKAAIDPADLAVPEADGPRRVKRIEGYTLALSWSPEFCRLREGDKAHALQCGGKQGAFGFILHGLWPEAKDAAYPQWCPIKDKVSVAEARGQLCRTPSANLLAHEWHKHGSCMVRDSEAYFNAAGILFDAVAFPQMEQLSRQDGLTVGNLRDAFYQANPGYARSAIGVKLNRKGWLQEVFLCHDRRFRPAKCASHQIGARDRRALKIWRGL